ncbi:MAG: hypothetical protein IPK19_30445 [Chloroflexi bacterium]|nr:hypothetical protein [Chloroflexota bacterium]
MNSPIQTTSRKNNRTQNYLVGAVAGLLFGLLSAYMFNRSGGEVDLPPGTTRVKSGELLGLALAALGVMRQISELGRPDLKQGKRR